MFCFGVCCVSMITKHSPDAQVERSDLTKRLCGEENSPVLFDQDVTRKRVWGLIGSRCLASSCINLSFQLSPDGLHKAFIPALSTATASPQTANQSVDWPNITPGLPFALAYFCPPSQPLLPSSSKSRASPTSLVHTRTARSRG